MITPSEMLLRSIFGVADEESAADEASLRKQRADERDLQDAIKLAAIANADNWPEKVWLPALLWGEPAAVTKTGEVAIIHGNELYAVQPTNSGDKIEILEGNKND
jgi:hypothetical protein